MPTSTARKRKQLVEADLGKEVMCECVHTCEAGHEERCDERADFQVSAICQAEGCDCAASVLLLCTACTITMLMTTAENRSGRSCASTASADRRLRCEES